MDTNSSHDQAKEAYFNLLRAGRKITLRQFSELSAQLLGKTVPLQTLQTWAKREQWLNEVVALESGDSEVESLAHLFDITIDAFYGSTSTAEQAANARAILDILQGWPRQALYAVASQVMRVRSDIYAVLDQDMPPRDRASLTKTWMTFGKYADVEVPVDDEGINPDSLVMNMSSG